MSDKRIDELYALCETEGLTLPLPVETILELEDAGHVVDLETGHIYTDGAWYTVRMTPVGEATVHLMQLETETSA